MTASSYLEGLERWPDRHDYKWSHADEQTDQDVSDKLAKLINKRWSEKLNSDKLSEKLKKHSRPGNLGSLVAPRENTEIWENMSHVAKREDLRSANTQNNCSLLWKIVVKYALYLI